MKNCLLALFSVISIFAIIETALFFMGFQPDYTGNYEIDSLQPARWWISDNNGSRFDKRYVDDFYRVAGKLKLKNNFCQRLRLLNNQGFHDNEEFVRSNRITGANRILVLGDSFTWGATADIGKSWVEIIKRELPHHYGKVSIWNTAIPGTGTQQALLMAKEFVPVLKPHLVILGFGTNDFHDNLFPLDKHFRRIDGLGILQYILDEKMNPIKLTPQEAFREAKGVYPLPYTFKVNYYLGRLRTYSFIINKFHTLLNEYNVKHPSQSEILRKEISETELYLTGLNNYVKSHKSQLLILLVPNREDLSRPSVKYIEVRKTLQMRSIKFVDPLTTLRSTDYMAYPDIHWNNSGHAKIGKLMVNYLVDHLPPSGE